MHPRTTHIVLPVVLLLVLSACDPARRVPAGRHLLVRSKVEVKDKRVEKDELASLMKQRPNKRILGLRFYLAMYNLPSPERLARRKAHRAERTARTNARRAQQGKPPKEAGRTFGEWLREVVGEPPVVLDSTLTARTVTQMRMYLLREGFFKGEVTDSVAHRGRRARLRYHVIPGEPHRLRHIRFSVDDPSIEDYLTKTWDGSRLRSGARFDADDLEAERDRVTGVLRELGYIYFHRDLVSFDADTAAGDHQVDVMMRLTRPMADRDAGLRGSREGTIHHIGQVTIDATGSFAGRSALPVDTLVREGYTFLYQGNKPRYRPQALLSTVYFHPGDRYQASMADRTFRRLTNLRVFDRVDMLYDTVGTGARDVVNCTMRLTPAKQQGFTVEGFGTNRGGFLGTSISLAYRHRNVFRNMGSLQAQVTLGLEAQQSITGQETGTGETSTAVGRDVLFNTVEIGPELTLRFPRPFVPARWFTKSAAPRTTWTALYNYQRRPDYNRTLARTSLGLEWTESPRATVGIFPVDLNIIRIPFLTQAFRTYLQQANDPVLTDSYTDHLIIGARAFYTLNTQGTAKGRDVVFLRTTLETSGNLLSGVAGLLGWERTTDTSGNSFHTIDGVRFAQFVKLDADLRYYRRLHEKSQLVFRAAAGVGVPFGNLGVLPFESSFFVGGANGLRAWRARSVGPGSYAAPLVAYDRIGEVRIEANAEYRFKLVGFFEMGLFVDAGNIWYLKEDPQRPGSGIDSDLLSDLAIGVGAGLRLNFDFFLVRFDLGFQTKDPALPSGERWIFERTREERALSDLANLNLGIGYPF